VGFGERKETKSLVILYVALTALEGYQ